MIAIIDTNVIADDPFFFNKFKNTAIVLPMVVLEELDKLKSYEGLVGKNCRTFIKQLRNILRSNNRNGTNTFHFAKDKIKSSVNDNIIIHTAQRITKSSKKSVTLYTNDINMQIKAKSLDVDAKSFEFEPDVSIYEQSYKELTVTDETLALLAQGRAISVDSDYTPNQYVLVNGALPVKYNAANGTIKRLVSIEDGIMGLKTKNLEQVFAMDALLDDNIKLVSLIGQAGTGKTLCGLAAALHKTLDEGKYDNIIIARPTVSMGEDLGYLPGTAEEKLAPWAACFFDNIDFLLGGYSKCGSAQSLLDVGVIKLESLSHMRGRSLSRKYILLDEIQNFSKAEIKTLLTRAGEGTKIVIMGDVYQIDNRHVDITNNGLTYATEQFREQGISANVTLTKSERSELAMLAGKLL